MKLDTIEDILQLADSGDRTDSDPLWLLAQEVRRLREDSARLDWLMEKAQWRTRPTMFGHVREYRFDTPPTTPTVKVREAIDAARNAETLKVRLEEFPV